MFKFYKPANQLNLMKYVSMRSSKCRSMCLPY